MGVNTYTDRRKNTHSFSNKNLKEFTKLLNKKANIQGMEAKIAFKNNCLQILLESSILPEQDKSTKLIQETLNNWQNKYIKQINIGGRIKGNKKLAWRQDIQIKSLPKVQDLSTWLNYGLAPQQKSSNTYEENDQQDKLLRFSIGQADTALLELSSVKEIVQISTTEILPVPHMNASILGLYNSRGNILWLADINHILGLLAAEESDKNSATKMAIVVEIETQFLGLVVSQIEEIEQHNLDLLQPPDQLVKPSLKPFVKGYLQSQNSLVLDPQALFKLGINNSEFGNSF